MGNFQDQKHIDKLMNEIGSIIMHDPKLAHGTWNAFALTVHAFGDDVTTAGFFYEIDGTVIPFSVRLPNKLIMELRQCMKRADHSLWQACLLQVKASDWQVNWNFEYSRPESYKITKDNLKQMQEYLRPAYGFDEYWCCSLSHDVISTLREKSPALIEDIQEDNLHCMITNAFLRAYRNGFESRTDLATFALYSFEFAPNFDDHPVIQSHIKNLHLVSGSFWSALNQNVDDAVWDELDSDSFYDGNAWYSELPMEKEEVA